MNQDDIRFKKQCQDTHKKVCGLLADDKIEEASELIKQIEKNANKWSEYERSVQIRSRLMRQMFAELFTKERVKKANLKREAKK